jgi:DNA polymerase III, gamma/tau subunits
MSVNNSNVLNTISENNLPIENSKNNLFFVDKYEPKNINEVKFHKEILTRLEKMSKEESMPHLLICGNDGIGKKTVIKLLLEMLYDADVHKMEDSVYTIRGSGEKLSEIVVKQSNYHIVIEPNNNNFDKYLIQNIVKEYAKKKPLDIFRTKKIFKTVLINNVGKLSYYAQTSLRRTMETYSKFCRFIMWCSCPTHVIEPLISRCMYITLPSPTDEQLFDFIHDVGIRERMNLSLDEYDEIITNSQGNVKEALWLLQLKKFGFENKNVYYYTINLIHNIIISHNLDQLTTTYFKGFTQTKHNNIYIRDLLYKIIISNISGTRIMRDLVNKLCDNTDIPNDCKYEIIEYVSKYEHNLVKGRRVIMHLEAMICKIMYILYKYRTLHSEYAPVFQKYYTDHEEEDILIKSIRTRQKKPKTSKPIPTQKRANKN